MWARALYIHWAYKVLVSHQYVRHGKSEDDRTNPRSDEALNSLLRRELDELGTAEGNATNVGENVVGNNQGCWEEKPDHPLENVVHDEMGLYDDQVKSHVRPSELGELEAVVTFFKRTNKEDEPCKELSWVLSLER